jgi:hypothetical protein
MKGEIHDSEPRENLSVGNSIVANVENAIANDARWAIQSGRLGSNNTLLTPMVPRDFGSILGSHGRAEKRFANDDPLRGSGRPSSNRARLEKNDATGRILPEEGPWIRSRVHPWCRIDRKFDTRTNQSTGKLVLDNQNGMVDLGDVV